MYRGDEDQIQDIAEVLARESGKTVAQCWTEALKLWRVRFETKVLLDKEAEEST